MINNALKGYKNIKSPEELAYQFGHDLIKIISFIIGIFQLAKGIASFGKFLSRAVKYIKLHGRKGIDNLKKLNTKQLKEVFDEIDINPNMKLPNRKKWKKIVDDVDNGKTKLNLDGKSKSDFTRHANYSELKAILHYESKHWTIGNNTGRLKYISKNNINSLNDPIHKGIDGVFEFSNPPPKYIVSEVKFNTQNKPDWKASVSKTVTKSKGSQMTTKWIEFNLKETLTFDKLIDIQDKGYNRVLISIDKGKVISQQLDETAKIIDKSVKYLK